MESLRLYWRPGAASMAPHAALAEIGVDYELVLLERDEAQSDAGYRALNPLGIVSTLVDGDLVLTESAAILLYLGDRDPEARLAPEERADYYRWVVADHRTGADLFLLMLTRWGREPDPSLHTRWYATGTRGYRGRDLGAACLLRREVRSTDAPSARSPSQRYRRPLPSHVFVDIERCAKEAVTETDMC